MTTPAMAEKEKAKAVIREQRERERLEKEKERMARIEKMQRAHSQGASSGGSGAKKADDDATDSDNDAEETAANKKEYQQKIVQLWKDRAKKPPKPGGSVCEGEKREGVRTTTEMRQVGL